MKKITLALLVLFIALPLMAGDADAASVDLEGNATTTFGMDLDSGATGFQNSVTAKIEFHFNLATTSLHSGSEDGTIYGEILLDEILLETVDSADSSEVFWDVDVAVDYAKIMGSGWWLSVKGPDAAIDYENAMQNGIIGIAAAWDGQMDMVSNTVASSGGFEFGIDIPSVLGLEVSIFSLTDWTSAEDNAADNAYGGKASVALKAVDGLTLEAAVNLGFGSDLAATTAATTAVYGWLDDMGTAADTTDDVALTDATAATGTPYWGVTTAAVAATPSALNSNVGIGAKLAYAIALGDITITPEVGADIVMVDDGMNIAIGNGLKIGLGGSEVTKAEDAIANRGTSVAWDDGVNDGLTLGWDYYMPADTTADSSLGIQAHFGLGVIENLQAAVGFEAADLMSDAASMGFAVFGRYALGDIVPWAGMFMRLPNETAGDDGSMIASAGLSWTNFIPLTTLTIEWDSGELQATDTTEADLGLLKASVKVAY